MCTFPGTIYIRSEKILLGKGQRGVIQWIDSNKEDCRLIQQGQEEHSFCILLMADGDADKNVRQLRCGPGFNTLSQCSGERVSNAWIACYVFRACSMIYMYSSLIIMIILLCSFMSSLL